MCSVCHILITIASSLLSSPITFLALCFLISCPDAFIIGHLSSVDVVEGGQSDTLLQLG